MNAGRGLDNKYVGPVVGFEPNHCTTLEYWYFAYGSNLCAEQMRTRLGALFIADHSNAELHPRLVSLPKHRVDFNMLDCNGSYYANITPAREDVLGVIYRCNSLALNKLDTFEDGYERTVMRVYDTEGQAFDAVVYVARPENVSEAGKPDFEYLSRVLRGGMHHGIPAEYLRTIQEAAGLSALFAETLLPQ